MRVSEAGLGVLQRLPALAALSLRGCQHLTDAAAPAVARLAALTRLDLRCCERFTGALPYTYPTLYPHCPNPVQGSCSGLREAQQQARQRSARSAFAAHIVGRLRWPRMRACCRTQHQAQCQQAARTERRWACMVQGC